MHFPLKRFSSPWLCKVTMEMALPHVLWMVCDLKLWPVNVIGYSHYLITHHSHPPSRLWTSLGHSRWLLLFFVHDGHWSCSIYHKLRSLRFVILAMENPSRMRDLCKAQPCFPVSTPFEFLNSLSRNLFLLPLILISFSVLAHSLRASCVPGR